MTYCNIIHYGTVERCILILIYIYIYIYRERERFNELKLLPSEFKDFHLFLQLMLARRTHGLV